MFHIEGKRGFARNTGITPEIIRIIADIADRSLTTAKEREEASQKYRDALMRALASEEKQPDQLQKQRPGKQQKKQK